CEWSGCPATDIHHINGRGKGKDVIENLMALSRDIHVMFHDHATITKEQLQKQHDLILKHYEKT
ncbi:unnamed protein product, partial [marine sediment metagenome]